MLNFIKNGWNKIYVTMQNEIAMGLKFPKLASIVEVSVSFHSVNKNMSYFSLLYLGKVINLFTSIRCYNCMPVEQTDVPSVGFL